MSAQPVPQPPMRPPGGGGGPPRATVVGGFPWQAGETAAAASNPTGMAWVRPAGVRAAADEEPLWARLDRAIRSSPPFTASLSVHVLVLLALALWIVRDRDDDKMTLDLSFASPNVVESPDPGIDIVAPEEPEVEPEPDEAMTEEPPVEDPIAAPPVITDMVDEAGGASETVAPVVGSLLDGREEGRREALVTEFGGSDATEAAVARALEWLVRQQDKRDGLWSLQGPYVDGGSQENRLAASAMALLALQGAGNTPDTGRHKAAVAKAWKGLVAKQLPDGRFDFNVTQVQQAHYAHAQATIAACELYGMTRNPAHAGPAQRALAYAIAAQGPNGGWRYEPGKDGDMSVTGWFMLALKSGQMAGLDVPDESFAGIARFLDTVGMDDGRRYGYRRESPQRPPVQMTAALTAEGLLCREFLGWRRDEPRLVQGVEWLLQQRPISRGIFTGDDTSGDTRLEKDVYAWYYITQVVHHLGGDPWERWNDRMREVLPAVQVAKGPESGSWDPTLDKWGHIGGRLFVTCFCTYMLEVYYRHLPLYDAAH